MNKNEWENEEVTQDVTDNLHDETCRMLPKMNEHDRRNQPLPENIIGRHFGTFTCQEN